jgi:hypothetical protein
LLLLKIGHNSCTKRNPKRKSKEKDDNMEIANDQENRENTDRPMPLAELGSNSKRRYSEQGLLLSKMSESNAASTTKRRQTIAVEPSGGARELKENSTAAATPSKTPSKHRFSLGSASAYYFKGVKSAKKMNLNSSQMEESFTADQSFDEHLAGYNGSVANPDESFMTLGDRSSSSDGSDILNKSTLSDTTDLTASTFVFAASSRQRLSHSALQHIAPEKINEKEQEELQVAPSPAVLKLKDTVSASPSRSPLGTIDATNKRRNTLPPGAIAGASSSTRFPPSTSAVSGSGGGARRESMQGPSPRTKVNMSPSSLRGFAATMRNSRLKRAEERDEDLKRRLSVGSEVSNTEQVAVAKQASAKSQRYSMATTTTDISVRLPSLSPASRTDFSMHSTDEKSLGGEDGDESDVNRSSLDDLFDGLLPEGDDNTAELMDDGETAELQEDGDTAELKGDGNTAELVEDGNTAELMEDGNTAELMETSFTSNASVASLERDSSARTGIVASRTSMSPASTITSATGLSNSASRLATSTAGSPGPLPSAITFESAHSPPKSPHVEATSPVRPSSARTTTTPPKLTPSKLKGSPGRVLNSRGFDSPAKNTRSASRTQDFSNDASLDYLSDQGEGDTAELVDTAELMDTSFTSNASVESLEQDCGSGKATDASRTSMSPASAITTPPSLSNAASRLAATSPGLLPSDIAFEIAQSPFKSPPVEAATTTSPFRPSSTKTTTTPTKLTPSKLKGSPGRVLNTKSVDSPARNTRSSSRTKDLSDDGSTSKRMRDNEEDSASGEQEENRHAINQSLDFSIVNEGPKRRKSSASSFVLNSALKKAGSVRRHGSVRKTVAFGSPDIMEFNKGSPSKSWTPVPKKLAKQMNAVTTMVDSTVEIDADMNALLNSVGADNFAAASKINAYRAGNTPIASGAAPLDTTEPTVELESNVQDLFAQPPITTEAPPLDNAEPTVELESSVQDLFAQPPIASKSAPSYSGDETVELEGNFQDFLAQPQEALDTQSDMSVDSPTAQMNITEPEHTVALEVDMASLLAYPDTKQQSRRHSISQPETFSDTDDDAMSMDVDASTVGGALNADEDNTIELECDMQALLGTAHGEKENQLRLSMSDSPSTIGRGRRSSMSTGRFSLAPKSRLSLTAEGDVIINDLSHIEQADSAVDASVASMSPQAEVEMVNEVLDLNEVELFLASGLDAKRAVSDILTEVSESTHALVMPVTTDAMNAILAEVCNEVDNRIDPAVDLGELLGSCEENRENYLTLQKALRAQDEDVCGQLERLAENVRIQVESEWMDWLVSVTESLKGPFDGMQEEINEFESRINGETELISETREILSTMESKAIQKAKRKSLDVRMVSEWMHNLVFVFVV